MWELLRAIIHKLSQYKSVTLVNVLIAAFIAVQAGTSYAWFADVSRTPLVGGVAVYL